ncbi:meiotic nuclear division protein 1 [Sporodiniella umbellata]|nr:meiotic nuclear division protein 1 [Sporodiniella umbellata]
MSRKGVSADEKRKRIQKIFHESGEFFQLKDIEKLGAKRGVVSQSVKDVLMSLVDDGLVTMDKIGTSNYFWSYPSAAIQANQTKLDTLQKQVEQEKETKARLEAEVEKAKESRKETEERESLLKELEELKATHQALQTELATYQDNDPVLHAKKEKAAQVAKEAANRWTENIWEIESYCVNRFHMERSVFKKSFDIPDDFDVLD